MMDMETGPIYAEPPRIVHETRKVYVQPAYLPELFIGMVFESKGEVCTVVAFDKDGQPWADCQRFE